LRIILLLPQLHLVLESRLEYLPFFGLATHPARL
jgi:hypothetical protein